MKLNWDWGRVEAECPVCQAVVAARGIVEVAPGKAEDIGLRRAQFARCPACTSLFAVGDGQPDYEDAADPECVTNYYIEQVAALDTMLDPLFRVERGHVQRYAEVGCSFGLSLDFARASFGWDVRGIEPSSLGAAGAALLDLPIERRHFTEAAPLEGARADLLLSSEVLEHIRDPHAFMRAIGASVAENGVVILSTPNGLSVQPETPEGALMQILCPGYHLTLFTPESLRGLLAAHGFGHCQIQASPIQVTAYASRRAFGFEPAGRTDRKLYAAYLAERFEQAADGSALQRGMASRLLRECAMGGRWAEAEALAPRVFDIYRRRHGLDLTDPESVRPAADIDDFAAFAGRYPLNLPALFYALGMVALLHRQAPAEAAAYFEAGSAWAVRTYEILLASGTADPELWTLHGDAQRHAMIAEARVDAERALARLARFSEQAGEREQAQATQEVFVELVNAGALEAAGTVAAQVEADLRARQETLGDEAFCRGSFASGVLALNHRGDRAGARDWLERAARVGSASEDMAAREVGAAAAAALALCAPEAEQRPEPGRGWRFWRRG